MAANGQIQNQFDSQKSTQVTVRLSQNGTWGVSRPTMTSGRVFDDALADAPVAVIGSNVAARLGVTATGQQNVIYLNGIKFVVIGALLGTLAVIVAALIGLLTSLYSAIRATRIEPVEAFRR